MELKGVSVNTQNDISNFWDGLENILYNNKQQSNSKSLWEFRKDKLKHINITSGIVKEEIEGNNKQHLKQLFELLFQEPIDIVDIDLFLDTYNRGKMTVDQFMTCRNQHLGMRFVSTVNWFRF